MYVIIHPCRHIISVGKKGPRWEIKAKRNALDFKKYKQNYEIIK